MNILIADDDPLLLRILADILRVGGHVVVTACNGEDALAKAIAGTFDAALLDIDMPGIDGWQVATAIREDEATRPMRLIALTGRGSAEERERSASAGFDLHMLKPVSLSQIANALSVSWTRAA